jgi:hypothetical protein
MIMYHGTDARNLPAILSQGLIPNPKKRAWGEDPNLSFHRPSRESLPGIYLTTNLITALSSARKGSNQEAVLVVVQVQTGNLIADEDSIVYSLEHGVPDHEYTIFDLYVGWQGLEQDLIKEDWRKGEIQKFIDVAQENFVESCVTFLNSQIKGGLHDKELSSLREVLEQGFFVVVARRAAHADLRQWKYEDYTHGVSKPDVGQAEADYKRLEDRLARVLKKLGRPEYLERTYNPTTRIETPIRYRGNNKIVAIILDKGYDYEKKKTIISVVYPPSGEVPAQLIKDWETAKGRWEPE